MKNCLVGLVFVHIDPVNHASHRAEIKKCVFLLETSPSCQTDVNPSRPQSQIHLHWMHCVYSLCSRAHEELLQLKL